jgi:hypothetical protein
MTWAQFSGAGSGVSSITFGTTGLTPSSVTTGAVTVAGTLAAANGGTGVSNNAAMTVTGSGNFAYTRTLTGTTNVTFPTTGTLATLAGTETFTNKTLTTPIISSISNTGTLTLPTSTDTLVGRATTDTLTNKSIAATQLTGTIAAARLPAGSVLQVVEGSTSTQVTVSTTVYTDTGLTASITPSSASSKILVMFSQQFSSTRTATTGDMNADLRLLRGATVLADYADYAQYIAAGSASALGVQVSATYLDSPATTSSTTYKLQGAPDSTANSQIANFQQGNRGRSSIILMEIAA